MTTTLLTELARCARDRALLAGARGACPRYWRELAAAAALGGHPWPAAEQLGREP